MTKIKHKKTLGFLSLFILLLIGVIIFFNPLVEKVANMVLKDLDPPLRSEISNVDSDLLEGKVQFRFRSLPEGEDVRMVEVEKIAVDADLDFQASIAVQGVDVKLDKATLEELQSPKDENEENDQQESSGLSSLQYLSSFELKDFNLTLVDSDLRISLEEILLDFDEGSGVLHKLLGVRESDPLTFLDIPVIGFGFAEDIGEAERKEISIHVPSPRFAVDQQLIDTFMEYAPVERQAQEEEGAKEAPMNLSLLVDEVTVSDLHAKAIGEKGDLDLYWSKLDFDLKKESLVLDELDLLAGKAPELLSVDRIRVEFAAPELLSQKPNLGIQINGAKVNVKKDSLAVLKSLPKPPESKNTEKKTNPLEKLSFIAAADSEAIIEEKKIALRVESFLLNAREGSLNVGDIIGRLVSENKPFLKVKSVTSHFEPQELIDSQPPKIEVSVNGVHADVSQKLMKTLGSSGKKEKAPSSPGPLPVHISRILVGDTSVDFLDFPGVGDQEYLRVRNIFGSIHNITLAPGTPLADFTFNATLEGESKFMVNGKFDLARDPFEWSLNYRLFDLDMTKLNDELRARIPITFNDGVLSFYGEAIKKDENIVGYYKPILKEGDYIGNEDEFKGVKHFLIETAATVASWFFERDESDSLATRIPFEVKDGKLDPDVSQAVWNAVEHGFLETDRVEPGVEHKYQLKQAQEEE